MRRSIGGNPETGPFFVEGAMAGDTLAIKFHRIRLNRNSAGSGDRIVPGAEQPGYYRDAKFDAKFSSEWKLDGEGGVATLAKPTERLKNFSVKPMLGCVGVAPPANQSYRAGGDALETSMDVEFTVDLIRGKSTQAPRFENDEYLMASGIAGSLQEALQQATTELARWLERDYKLSPNESNVILGTSIHYDIAEVVDPQVHIVAKVSKAVMATLK